MIKAQAKAETTNDRRATLNDFQMMGHLSLLKRRSSAASKTIMIRPTIPKSSSTLNKRSLTEIHNKFNPCLIRIPNTISMSTEGTFVFFEMILKKYEMIK